MQVPIPNNWTPRPYQLEPLVAFDQGKRRLSLIWHRRAGKDSWALNHIANQSQLEIGTYWHLFPLQTQARRAIWHGMDAHGVRFIDQAFPQSIRTATRQQDMMMELNSGSTYQMAGSDTYDSLVGSNVKGVVFSEWALCDPRAWDYIRPIIRENGGWAAFITTYRGKNHAYAMHTMALKDPAWFASTKSVDDTERAPGVPVLTAQDIQAERDEGMEEPLIQQEYFCSPMAAFAGAYWGAAMRKMVKDKRIAAVAYDPLMPVDASFDLGMDDHTTAIYTQDEGNSPRIIGSQAWQGTAIPDICHEMSRLPFPVKHLYLPHDARVRGMNTGLSRERTFQNHGYETTIVESPPGSKQPGIELARNLLGKTWIDEAANFTLIEAFQGYRTEESNMPGVMRLTPLHSWESHYADAWQTFAKGRRDRMAAFYQPRDLTQQRKRAQRPRAYL